MKMSDGVRKPWPVAAFLALFVLGALLQALAMRRDDMGVVYVAVLGLEAVAAVAISVVVLREEFSVARAVAIGLVFAGAALLRRCS